jgi:hypothetical protein
MRSYAPAEVVFIALLVLNIVLWSQSQRSGSHALLSSDPHVSKRSLLGLLASEQNGSFVEDRGEDEVRDSIDS